MPQEFMLNLLLLQLLEVAHEDKLVLPVYQFHDNIVAPDSRDKTIIERSSSLTRHSPISGPVRTRKFHDERYNRNMFKVTGYMGISFHAHHHVNYPFRCFCL